MPKTQTNTATKTTKKTSKTVKAGKAEPVPDDTNDVVENGREFATYAEAVKARKEVDNQMKALQKRRVAIEKECDILHTKTEKDAKKGKKRTRNPDPNRKKSGISSETAIPTKLLNFLNKATKADKFSEEKLETIKSLKLNKDSKIPRTTITSYLHDYIKNNKLHHVNDDGVVDKKHYDPDQALIDLLDITDDDEEFRFETFQRFLGRLYPKSEKATKTAKKVTKSETVEEEDEEEDEEEEDEEEEEEDEEEDEDEEEEDEDEEDEEEEEDVDEEDEEDEEEEQPKPVKKTTKKTAKKTARK